MTTIGAASVVERYRAARADAGLVVLEGLHPLKHALRFGAEVVAVVSPNPKALAQLAEAVAPDVAADIGDRVEVVDSDVFADLAPVPPPTGVIAIAHRVSWTAGEILSQVEPSPVVVLENPSRLGNVGASILVVAAAGAAGLVTLGPHDPWHPEAVRGAAGLQFAVPTAAADALPETDRPIVAVDPSGTPLDEAVIPPRSVFVFGSERRGLSSALARRAEMSVGIPMEPGVSSLNLATSVAVVLYQARRS